MITRDPTAAQPALSPWQRSDGFPTDEYFDAVVAALAAAGVIVESWFREEPWEANFKLLDDSIANGPLGGYEAVWLSWRVDEGESDADNAKHAEDFTGLGWYLVPYSDAQKACGDYANELEHQGDPMEYLADPETVAEAVRDLVIDDPIVCGPAGRQPETGGTR